MNLDYRRAALLSCHHAAWQARSNHPPVSLPSRIRPWHRDIAADLFAHSSENAADKRARSNALAILEASPRVRHSPLLPSEQQAEIEALRPKRGGCPCCGIQAAHDAMSDLPKRPIVHDHSPPTSVFDSDSMTTTVTTTVAAEVSPVDAKRLLFNADPRNWKTAAKDFFSASDPGVYQDGVWTPKPWRANAGGGMLRETVHWNWNGSEQVSVDNILNIDGLKIDNNSIAYRYSLSTCLQSRLLVVWDSGGLDIDDGEYEAHYNRTTRIFRIEASKRVRFTAPSDGSFEIALALNLMAPATISMLLQKLVDVSRDGEA